MLIHCPNCDTAYNVNEEDLQDSGGQVVCCRCDEVFDAEIYKVPDDAELLNDTINDSAMVGQEEQNQEWQPDLSLFEQIDEDKQEDAISVDTLIAEAEANQSHYKLSQKEAEILEEVPTLEGNSFPSLNDNELDIDTTPKQTSKIEKPIEDELSYSTNLNRISEPIPNSETEVEEDNFTNPDILSDLLEDNTKQPPSQFNFEETKESNITPFDFEKENTSTSSLVAEPIKFNTSKDEIPLEESAFSNDSSDDEQIMNDLIDEFDDTKIKEDESEDNNLGHLLDNLSIEVVNKDRSFVDEAVDELSDLLDNLSDQGLLKEDSALSVDNDSDLILEKDDSDLEEIETEIPSAPVVAVEHIDEPDRRTEPLSYFADSVLVGDVDFSNKTKKGGWLKIILIFILGLLLITQIAWFEQHLILKNPTGRAIAETICFKLKCQLPRKVDLTKIKVIKREFKIDPYIPHALQLRLIIANTAEFQQPYPLIKVDLFNLHHKIIASRVFKPEEYLNSSDNKDFMPINTPKIINFQFEDTKRRATEFDVKFY